MHSLKDSFYIDSGAFAHLIPSQSSLQNYIKFSSLEILAVNNRKLLAYSSSTAQVSASVDGVEHKADLEEVFYIPDIHVHLWIGSGDLPGKKMEESLLVLNLWARTGQLRCQ